MPSSSCPPPLVLPDSREARAYFAQMVAGDCDVEFCREYREDRHPIYSEYEMRTPLKTCAKRSREGDRTYNWCYRCMAGYPCVGLDEKDSESDRDRLTV